MASKSESFELRNETESPCDVPIRDLQSLLKKGMGDQLRLTNFQAYNLLLKGENFASTMLKVTAYIKRTKEASEEALALVAKMISPTESKKDHFNFTINFKKEIFIFEELIPTYRELQEEVEFRDSELLDILPHIYGTRLSLNPDSPNADNDVCILMEDLNFSGYKTMDRKNGLDFQHARMALIELAKYHALGILCKHRRPEFFNFTKNLIKVNVESYENVNNDCFIDQFMKILCSGAKINQYKDRVEKAFFKCRSSVNYCSDEENIWLTISHGDFYINNVMFRHSIDGNPVGIKIIDFADASYEICLIDLPYFLMSNCNKEVVAKHIDELLNIYYHTFVELLKRFGIDVTSYTREDFDQQLKVGAQGKFLHVTAGLKFMSVDLDKNFDFEDFFKVVATYENNENFFERANLVVQNYIERNWI